MKHRNFRLATAAASALVLAGTLTGTAAMTAVPAQAAAREACTGWQHKEFPTSGFNTDVSIKLCVEKDTHGHHLAYADVKWRDGGGGGINLKFDNFDVRYRLERYDADYADKACDLTSEIYWNSSGSDSCLPAYSTSQRDGGWTADGYVAYNLDDDGKGGKKWSLHGSPQIN